MEIPMICIDTISNAFKMMSLSHACVENAHFCIKNVKFDTLSIFYLTNSYRISI